VTAFANDSRSRVDRLQRLRNQSLENHDQENSVSELDPQFEKRPLSRQAHSLSERSQNHHCEKRGNCIAHPIPFHSLVSLALVALLYIFDRIATESL
jgi:hypothetical protein